LVFLQVPSDFRGDSYCGLYDIMMSIWSWFGYLVFYITILIYKQIIESSHILELIYSLNMHSFIVFVFITMHLAMRFLYGMGRKLSGEDSGLRQAIPLGTNLHTSEAKRLSVTNSSTFLSWKLVLELLCTTLMHFTSSKEADRLLWLRSAFGHRSSTRHISNESCHSFRTTSITSLLCPLILGKLAHQIH
jgi:hypothetical protein